MNKLFYELQFEIENACLLDCVHCSSADMRMHGKRGYTDEELLEFISLFHGKAHVYFTGGEPLLYENLLNLCTQILSRNKEIDIGLYTTGNCAGNKPITDDVAAKLHDSGITDCYFSIYSENQHEHDAWTSVNGSLINTVESVNALKRNRIVPKAHLVLNRFNQHKIKKVIEFCQEIGLEEVRILRLSQSGNAKVNWEEIGIPIEEQNLLISQLIQDRKNYSVKLSFSGYPDLHPCRSWEDAIGCQAGIKLLYMDADGYVYPCACTKRNPGKYKLAHITEINKIQDYIASKEKSISNEMCLNEMSD